MHFMSTLHLNRALSPGLRVRFLMTFLIVGTPHVLTKKRQIFREINDFSLLMRGQIKSYLLNMIMKDL